MPAAVNRELEKLNRAFTVAVDQGLIFARPKISKLKENNVNAPIRVSALILKKDCLILTSFGSLQGCLPRLRLRDRNPLVTRPNVGSRATP